MTTPTTTTMTMTTTTTTITTTTTTMTIMIVIMILRFLYHKNGIPDMIDIEVETAKECEFSIENRKFLNLFFSLELCMATPCHFKTADQINSNLKTLLMTKVLVFQTDLLATGLSSLELYHGLYSLSELTSYLEISWRLEAATFGFILFSSLWNLKGTLAGALPICLSNFRAIRSL